MSAPPATTLLARQGLRSLARGCSIVRQGSFSDVTKGQHRDREDGFPTDPSGIQEPHDVLAAEEFAMPTRDDRYPVDPSGIQEPHDVLAAEEFAMPAPGSRASVRSGRLDLRAWLPLSLLGAGALAFVLRRRG
jgi:hypothetical protein